jgi:hypothetical protein
MARDERSPQSIEPRRRPHSLARLRCRHRSDGAVLGACMRTVIVERSKPWPTAKAVVSLPVRISNKIWYF